MSEASAQGRRWECSCCPPDARPAARPQISLASMPTRAPPPRASIGPTIGPDDFYRLGMVAGSTCTCPLCDTGPLCDACGDEPSEDEAPAATATNPRVTAGARVLLFAALTAGEHAGYGPPAPSTIEALRRLRGPAAAPVPKPPPHARSVQELRELLVRASLSVSSDGGAVNVKLWVPRRCVICRKPLSTSFMQVSKLRARNKNQVTCDDEAWCGKTYRDQQVVARCEQEHGGDRANFRDRPRASYRGQMATKALPWDASLSFYWDCRQCGFKVRPRPGRPPRGCRWDEESGSWVQRERNEEPASSTSLPGPPAKKDFVVAKKFDPDAYLVAKQAWFEQPGVKRAGEEYSEEAYLRAFKRAKRDVDVDNRKRKSRRNYGVTVSEKRDARYSDWG